MKPSSAKPPSDDPANVQRRRWGTSTAIEASPGPSTAISTAEPAHGRRQLVAEDELVRRRQRRRIAGPRRPNRCRRRDPIARRHRRRQRPEPLHRPRPTRPTRAGHPAERPAVGKRRAGGGPGRVLRRTQRSIRRPIPRGGRSHGAQQALAAAQARARAHVRGRFRKGIHRRTARTRRPAARTR